MGEAIGHPRRKHTGAKKQKIVDDVHVKRESPIEKGISDLPDELLVAILSCMPLVEAAQTSVLSRRWRYLWYFTFDYLEFDPTDTTPETTIRREEFLRFLTDQMNWCDMYGPSTVYSICLERANGLNNAIARLHEKELEVELAENRLKKYEKKKKKTLSQKKKERYTCVCNGIKETVVRKSAEVVKEQEKIAKIEVYQEKAKIHKGKLLNMLRNFSAEKWIIVTLAHQDLIMLSTMQASLDDKELYFCIAEFLDTQKLDLMFYIASDIMGIEDLKPGRLYLFKNKEFTTVSPEQAAQLGFQPLYLKRRINDFL